MGAEQDSTDDGLPDPAGHPFHYALADAFTLCDADHCSLIGSTDPTRFYLWTGSTRGAGTDGGPVIAGYKIAGSRKNENKSETDDIVERSLKSANLWEEVKQRLTRPGAGLSGGQQQRLCIARAIAVEPSVLLMDEPCSALDPISTLAIEDLISELKSSYTIVIVTHNMQQAARVSDRTAFFNLAGVGQPGKLVEYDDTAKIFSNPSEKATEDYISGRFG